jgi:hypothetical protein
VDFKLSIGLGNGKSIDSMEAQVTAGAGSHLPCLWGLRPMVSLACIIDLSEMVLSIKRSDDTRRSLPIMIVSGHLVLPVDEFQANNHGKPLPSKTAYMSDPWGVPGVDNFIVPCVNPVQSDPTGSSKKMKTRVEVRPLQFQMFMLMNLRNSQARGLLIQGIGPKRPRAPQLQARGLLSQGIGPKGPRVPQLPCLHQWLKAGLLAF